MSAPVRILFVSSSNAARSQMAEAILRRLGGDRFEVCSAGFEPHPVARGAMQAMQEVGIDLTGQQAKHINDYLDCQFDHVVVLCGSGRHFCPDFPHDKDSLVWTVDEPTEATGNEDEQLAAFRVTRDRLQAMIVAWLQGLDTAG